MKLAFLATVLALLTVAAGLVSYVDAAIWLAAEFDVWIV